MLHRIFNLRNIYGFIAFMCLLFVPGAVESEMYITAFVMIVVMGITAMLSMREDGIKN